MSRKATEIVKKARATRLSPKMIISGILDKFVELHGDRNSSDDQAIVGGIGLLKDLPVTIFVSSKGVSIDAMKKNHFGEPMPQGYRKVLRLSREAEKFDRPILTFINLSGAFPGERAERFGQATAIADNLLKLGNIKVPFISVFYGEGGSGGALALACGDEIWMFKDSTFSARVL